MQMEILISAAIWITNKNISRNEKCIVTFGVDYTWPHLDYNGLCIDYRVERCKSTVILLAPCCQIYTEKKVIRDHFSNSFLIYEPCAKLNDVLPKDVSFK